MTKFRKVRRNSTVFETFFSFESFFIPRDSVKIKYKNEIFEKEFSYKPSVVVGDSIILKDFLLL